MLTHALWEVTQKIFKNIQHCLTLSWRRSLSYWNQSIDLQSKSMNCFQYDRDICHESVKLLRIYYLLITTKDTVLFQMLEVKQRLFCVNFTPLHVLFENNFNWRTYVVLRFSIFSVISFDFSGSLVTICSANVLTVTIRSAFTLTSCSRYYKDVFRILSNKDAAFCKLFSQNASI